MKERTLILIIMLFIFTINANWVWADSKITKIYTDNDYSIIYFDTEKNKKNILARSPNKELCYRISEISSNKKWITLFISPNITRGREEILRLIHVPSKKMMISQPYLFSEDKKGEYIEIKNDGVIYLENVKKKYNFFPIPKTNNDFYSPYIR